MGRHVMVCGCRRCVHGKVEMDRLFLCGGGPEGEGYLSVRRDDPSIAYLVKSQSASQPPFVTRRCTLTTSAVAQSHSRLSLVSECHSSCRLTNTTTSPQLTCC